MQGIQLVIPTSAIEALNRETEWPFAGCTLYENEIERLLLEWSDDETDTILPREHVEILRQTGSMPVASLQGFADLFHNIGVEWTEDSMREQGIGEPTEESQYASSVADAWYALADSVRQVSNTLARLNEIDTIVSYEVQAR